MISQNRSPWRKGRGFLIFAQNSIHSRNKFRECFTQNKLAEIEFFDRFDRKGGYDAFDRRGYLKITKIMKQKIPAQKSSLIYDMGCGSGAFTYYIKKAYSRSRIIGMDISGGCITRAKKQFPDIEFRIGDIESTKIKSESVDVVCYTGILHHFANFSKVTHEAYRILKPGGRVFSYDPNYYNPAFWLYRNKSSPFYSSVGITSNERLLKSTEIERVFKDENFEMKTKIVSGIKFSYVESKGARGLLLIYNFLDQILAVTPLASKIGSFILGFGRKKI